MMEVIKSSSHQMLLDAHHHFWQYDPAQYGWIGDTMPCIRRDFLPADLKAEIAKAGIDGVVSVQARQSIEETNWLLGFAAHHAFIRGVVGWVPLVDANVAHHLGRLAKNRKLKAVRHVVHDEPDPQFILRDDFNRGISLLTSYGLVYDILVFERHLPQTIRFVDRHPSQVFVLDHIAKPLIKDNVLEPWRANIRELARRGNVYCKLSGMVTEADWRRWTVAKLRPYVETVIEAFGPRRVMFGSDWPVCLVACEYARCHSVVKECIAGMCADDQARILGGTAEEAYKL